MPLSMSLAAPAVSAPRITPCQGGFQLGEVVAALRDHRYGEQRCAGIGEPVRAVCAQPRHRAFDLAVVAPDALGLLDENCVLTHKRLHFNTGVPNVGEASDSGTGKVSGGAGSPATASDQDTTEGTEASE